MTTDIHEALPVTSPPRHLVFWCCVVVAIGLALAGPLMPPRVLVDTTQDLQ